jgi:hypothetical protein
VCFWCSGTGHNQKDCGHWEWSWKKEENERKEQERQAQLDAQRERENEMFQAKLLSVASISIVSGDHQTTKRDTLFPAPLVVQLSDQSGRPVALEGEVVRFSTDKAQDVGQGWTDANGQASTTLWASSWAGSYPDPDFRVTAVIRLMVGGREPKDYPSFTVTFHLSVD